MQAIILAAGMGQRLGPLTANTPKSLLEIGQGVTVVESQLDHLAEAGVTHVQLVVGYKAEQIEAKLRDYAKLEVSTTYNPFFDVSNNLVSAWMAKDQMNADFLLVNGDDVFRSRVVTKLLESQEQMTMVIDRKQHYDEDDMKVFTEASLVRKVSKKLSPEETNGESIGMILFRGKGVTLFRSRLEAMVRDLQHRNAFYLQAIQSIMDDGFPVHYSECAPEDWAEIDFHPDLNLIRSSIERFSSQILKWG